MSKSPANKNNSGDEDRLKTVKNSKKMTVEIQYCVNCQVHFMQNKHSSSRYQAEYDYMKKKLWENGILVKKRQIPRSLIKKSPYSPSNIYYCVDTNLQVYFPRIEAFEVYFNNKKIYSKLQTKKFPTLEILLISIFKHSLESNDYQSLEIGKRKKKKMSHMERIAYSINQNQFRSNTLDFQSLQESKQKYQSIKKRLQQKMQKLDNKQDQTRPNTTHIYRRSFQVRSRGPSKREYYSRGHEKTNEELLNDNYLDASIKVQRANNKTTLKYVRQNEENSKQKGTDFLLSPNKKVRDRIKNFSNYSVYLQSLVPKKTDRKAEFQANKIRLRTKIKNYRLKHNAEMRQTQQEFIRKYQGKQEDVLENEEKILYADFLKNMKCN